MPASSYVDSVPHLPPSGGTELFAAELVETVAEPRFDRLPLKLESRGVTSHRPSPSKSRSEAPQLEFWEARHIWSEAIVAKLDGIGRSDIADQIRDCHSQATYKRCCACAALSKFYNRCERKWCPLCQPRLAHDRRESVEWWTREVQQPKHVVLTARNSAKLCRETVREFKAAFSRLRRSKFARNWRGGFYSVEVTNEGRGWHLHLHALVDANWIDSGQLAIEWARCIGQDFSIVKVKDVRDASYLAEVTKYAVKGSQLSVWSGEDVAAFVDAFDNVRTFGVFGSLYAKRTEWRAWLDQLHGEPSACECGCTNFRLLSENELAEINLQLHRASVGKMSMPPPQPFLLPPQFTSPYQCGA